MSRPAGSGACAPDPAGVLLSHGGSQGTRRGTARLLLVAVLLAPLSAACGDAHSSVHIQRGEHFYQAEELGRTVTVRTAVSEVLRPRLVELSGGDLGRGPLLALSESPVETPPGTPVRATGTVGQLHTTFPAEKVPYVQRDLYDEHGTVPYLYGVGLEPVSSPSR